MGWWSVDGLVKWLLGMGEFVWLSLTGWVGSDRFVAWSLLQFGVLVDWAGGWIVDLMGLSIYLFFYLFIYLFICIFI